MGTCRSLPECYGLHHSICVQALALGGMYWISLTNGYVFGQMTGMINALQKNDEGTNLTDSQISWITSSFTITSIIGYWSAAAISDQIGRRWSFIIFSIILTIYWVILSMSHTMLTIMLSRTIGSIGLGALFSLTISIPPEYTPLSARGIYLNLITTVAPAVGTAFGHIIGTILHWRIVTLLGVVFSTVGVFLPYFWVESPHWLASRGMFTECEQSFRKLHGVKAEKELHSLIKLEQSKTDAAKALNSENTLKKLRLAINKKYLWELMILAEILYIYMIAAGKLIFSILATVILEEITGTSDVLLFTLLIHVFIISGSSLSCVLIRKMTMRNLFFSTGFIANAVLIILSACLYFQNDDTHIYLRWVHVSLLALYFIIINAGPYPICEALIGEVFPLDLKLYCFFISGLVSAGFASLSILLFQPIVESLGYYGLFLMNVAIMSLCLGYIWIKLPETKGRTLQEIEVYFKTKDFDVDRALNNAQMTALI